MKMGTDKEIRNLFTIHLHFGENNIYYSRCMMIYIFPFYPKYSFFCFLCISQFNWARFRTLSSSEILPKTMCETDKCQ